MLKHILSSYLVKLYVFTFSIVLYSHATFASQVTPDNSIIVSSNDYKLCLGEEAIISLSATEADVQYQLKDNNSGNIISNTITGDGLEASFESFTPLSNTIYTVVATHIPSLESVNLSSNISIEILPMPNASLNVSPSHNSLCVGESTSITIDNTETDVLYQIEGGANANESSKLGNGTSLIIENFEPFRSATYHINALREGCETKIPLTEDFDFEVRLPPATELHIYSSEREICIGEKVILSLSPSSPTADYQLLDGENPIGSEITGNSGYIDFDVVKPDVTTIYSVDAIGHYCIDPVRVNFTFKVDVHQPSKTDRQLISNKTEVCEGESFIISVLDSQEDVIYQLHNGTDFLESQIIGNGNKANFPEIYPDNNSNYFVYSREMVCPDKLKLDNQIDINLISTHDFPIENFATPGEICLGETFDIELPLTENNITYHLYDNNISVESITSDGSPVVFENLLAEIDSKYKVLIENCVDEVIAAEPKLEIHSTPHVDIVVTDEINGSDGTINVIVHEGKTPYNFIFENYKTIISDEHYIELSGMKAGDYKLAVVDANSCKSTDTGHEVRIDFSN